MTIIQKLKNTINIKQYQYRTQQIQIQNKMQSNNPFFKKIIVNQNKPQTIDLNSIFRQKNTQFENNLNKNIQNIASNINFKSPLKLQRNRIESVSPKADSRKNQNYFFNNNRKYSIANNQHQKYQQIKINGAQTTREKSVQKLMIIQNIIKNCNSRTNLQEPKPNNIQQKLLNSKNLMCFNNDNKPAKYYISSNPTNKYCKKCAIKLISQGIKMIEIVNRQVNEEIKQSVHKVEATKTNFDKKEQILQKFTKQVLNLQQKIKNEVKKLGNQREDIFVYVRDQQQKIKIYYENITKIINDFKIRDLNKMNQYYQQMTKHFIQQQKQLKQSIQMLHQIKNDIIPNIQVIKIKIDDIKILELLKAYRKNLSDIQSKLSKENPKIISPQCFRLATNRLNYQQISCITYPCENEFSFEKELLKQMNNYQKNNVQITQHAHQQNKKQSSMDTNYFTEMIKTFSENGNQMEIGKTSPVFKKI